MGWAPPEAEGRTQGQAGAEQLQPQQEVRAGLACPGCPTQIKLWAGLEEGSPFAMWTRPPKTTLGPCDQEQGRLRPPAEGKMGLNLRAEETGYLACWNQ